MPIEVATAIRVLNQEEFHALHHQVLCLVFEIHNEFGRLLDEALFKTEIAARCEACGLAPAQREVRVRASHGSFYKDYFLDLLLGESLLLEAKTAETLTAVHRMQCLNYLLLIGMQHGSVINLRPEQVQHHFVSTQLTPEKRHSFAVVDRGWCATDDQSRALKNIMAALLTDWGAFLELNLYREALTHFLGGPETVLKTIPVYSGQRLLGQQRVHLVNAQTAFSVSAIAGDSSHLQEHQRRFLRHTSLTALQWINLNHHQIEFRTLLRN